MSTVRTIEHDTWIEIVLDHPSRRNAISPELIADLITAVEEAKAPQFRSVLLRGEGPAFCVGGDVKNFAELASRGEHIPIEMPHALHKALKGIRDLEKPVIGAIHGACAGAGVSLMLACDLAFAADSAKFFLAYLSIGISPDGGSTYFLPRHVGLKKAAELYFSTKPSTAQEALDLGLINAQYPVEELLQKTQKRAEKLAMGPTLAYGKLKKLLNHTGHHSLEKQLDMEAQLFSDSSRTEDFREGVTAFAEKRIPEFKAK